MREPTPEAWRASAAVAAQWAEADALRTRVMRALEAARADKVIGASLEATVVLPEADHALLGALGANPLELLIVSAVESGSAMAVRASTAPKCPRCWQHRATADGSLCPRCEVSVRVTGAQAEA